jgi:hypothetical protein
VLPVPFTPDEKIQKIVAAYSLDAVDFVAANFKINLDWSDASIRQIETILDKFHRDLGNSHPTEEQITKFSKIFGSYIGEVFRKNHGGQWGMVELDGQRFPGMQSPTGTLFWPFGRARNRMVNGDEDNVWDYYQELLKSPAAEKPR